MEREVGVIIGVHDLVEMWGLLGVLSEVYDLEEGMGRRLQQVSWPRQGYTEAQWGSWRRAGHGKLQGDPSPLSAPCFPAEQCSAEEVCVMSWYTPMPVKNGSVVMHVDVSSNGLGPFIPNKRCPSPHPGYRVDSGRDFLISRLPKKPGGDHGKE